MVLSVVAARTYDLLNTGDTFVVNINSDAIVIITLADNELDNGLRAWHICGGNQGCLLDLWVDDGNHDMLIRDWCSPSEIKIQEVVVTE